MFVKIRNFDLPEQLRRLLPEGAEGALTLQIPCCGKRPSTMLSATKYLVIVSLCLLSVWISTRSNYNVTAWSNRHLRSAEPVHRIFDISPERSLHISRNHHRVPNSLDTGGGNTVLAADDGHATGDDDHATDDHSTGHPSLFEALSAIHVEIGTYSVLIIIGFIIILKQIIEGLYAFTHESAFHPMVKKIEEELMIVGSSSFIFKVVLNTTTFGQNIWAYPLEFGEVLVPLIAFSYCGIGIFLVIVSLKQCYTWSRAHNLKAMEILDDYFTASKTWYFWFTWKPMNKSIEQMEFRIFHNIFCSTFKIKKGAFAFDEYVAKVFQRSVLELIEIRLLDWFYVSVLLLVNLLRVKLNGHLNRCDVDDQECDDQRTVRLFTLFGSLIFVATFLLMVLSRRLEYAIMSKNGPRSHVEYAQYIRNEEEKHQVQSEVMDLDQLKVAAAKAKEKEVTRESAGGAGRMTMAALKTGVSMRFTTLKVGPGSSKRETGFSLGSLGKMDSVRRTSNDSASGNKIMPFDDATPPPPSAFAVTTSGPAVSGKSAPSSSEMATTPHARNSQPPTEEAEVPDSKSDRSDVSSVDLDESERGEAPGEMVHLGRSASAGVSVSGAGKAVAKETSVRSVEAADVSAGSSADHTPRATAGRVQRRSLLATLTREISFGEHSKEAMDVFWCGKPELYFESVQILFMVIAFYAALWLTVMASSVNSSVWKFLSILPAILICCFFFYIVKTAALLKAIYEVDTDAMLEVIEETEAAKQLSTELRDAVLARLETTGEDPFNELQRLYNEIDVNRSDSLSRREFGQFMELMGISFSVKKWERIYKEIDRNYDNEISLNEFLLFLYPDHDIAVSMENKRLKAISQRVMDRANNLMSHLTPLTEMVTTAAVAVGAAHERPSSTPETPAARRRSVVAHIHPNMSRQSSLASSNGGGGNAAK